LIYLAIAGGSYPESACFRLRGVQQTPETTSCVCVFLKFVFFPKFEFSNLLGHRSDGPTRSGHAFVSAAGEIPGERRGGGEEGPSRTPLWALPGESSWCVVASAPSRF
ncbi:unnamed protein product, partial [Ectocarpus sp. 4 AP-2014]